MGSVRPSDPAIAWYMRFIPGKYRKGSGSQNTSLAGNAAANDPTDPGLLLVGTVVRAGVGSHDVTVRLPDRPNVGCVVLTQLSGITGASQSMIPVEGSSVLVHLSSPLSTMGTVLGVVPKYDRVGALGQTNGPVATSFAHQRRLESGATAATEAAHTQPVADKKDHATMNANDGRPLDTMPGDYVVHNDQGVALAVTRLAASVTGSPNAQLRVSPVDDQVRIVSGHYQHMSAAGTTQIFNDGGLVSQETGITPHQCERSGCNDYGTSPWRDLGAKFKIMQTSLKTRLENVRKRIVARKRLQLMVGHLGDLVHLFVAKPDPSITQPETEDDKNKDQGLMHAHIDGSGRLTVKSAAGVSFQRCDRIPVPKRTRQPWDPEGDKTEDTLPIQEKKPFTPDSTYPYAGPLQLRDANAWRDRCAVQRIIEQPKDFHLPEESALTTPDNEYDKLGKASENFSANAKRRSFFNLEPDGSIVLRDAWGGEIAMRGGNIIITCPGQIEVRSGKSTVVLAGHDLVMKARESMDLTATLHDVRIKADRNLHMAAGSDTSTQGGVLIESLATAPGRWSGSGEQTTSRGIVLKATTAGVLVAAKDVHLAGERSIKLESFDADGVPSGNISLSAKTFTAHTTRRTSMTCAANAGIFITRGAVFSAAQRITMAAARSLALTKADQVMIAPWTSIGSDTYGDFKSTLQDVADVYEATDWLSPFAPEDRTDIKFTFRSPEEYGTLKASEVDGSSTFAIYQAAWEYMVHKRHELIKGALAEWTERKVNETLPWPGDVGKCYVTLADETNVESQTGMAKARNTQTSTGGRLVAESFDRYSVLT